MSAKQGAKKVYEVLADVFANEDAKTCFALLGDANMYWANSMAQRGCKSIYVRDEHNAVAAAMAWARCTGKVGVATVTCGPGLTQILTALPAAVRANIPLVIMAGEAPINSAWYNQAISQAPFVEACGATYQALHNVEDMPTIIRDAFLNAKTESRPIVLGAPFDLLEQDWLGSTDLPEPSATFIGSTNISPPSQTELQAILPLVQNAQRVVVMAGLGAIKAGARDACLALSEQLNALTATTLPARGYFHDDPHYLGVAGGFSSDTARACLQDADLVIAVGASLARHNSDGGKLFDAHSVLHIDLEPRETSQGRAAAQFHLQADAKVGVESLINALKSAPSVSEPLKTDNRPWNLDVIAHQIKHDPADSVEYQINDGLLDPRDVVQALDESIPKDWFTVNSSGHCSNFFAHMVGRPANRFLTIREFGAIGNGIAFAMGAAVANPDVPTVLFDGDGSLMMHIQELETILRHKLNVLICVMNDGAYGSEIHKLRAHGLSDEGAVFGRPDFANIAAGFGGAGETVSDLSVLPDLVAQFKDSGKPTIWDFHVSDTVLSPVMRRAHS